MHVQAQFAQVMDNCLLQRLLHMVLGASEADVLCMKAEADADIDDLINKYKQVCDLLQPEPSVHI